MKTIINIKSMMAAMLACYAFALFAWDVEHDEVAQLVGEFLPSAWRWRWTMSH